MTTIPVAGAEEIAEKDRRIRAFLAERDLSGLLISQRYPFAWATGGRDNHVPKGTDVGAGHALWTRDGGKYLLCDSIEEPRLRDEEMLEEQGFSFVAAPWYAFDLAAEVQKLTGGVPFGADTPIGGATLLAARDLAPLRYELTPDEIARYRWLGGVASEALETAAQAIDPGMTEHEIGAVLDHFLEDEGVTPHLTLVAADERARRFRHPIPTGKTAEKYVMLVTGAQAYGLVTCATRIVSFGPVDADLARRHDATCTVDTVLNASTTPGASVGEVFARAQAAYAEQGFPDEWTHHHQGGATGYAGRDYKATPTSTQTVLPNQAFAWNPSIAGTKCEDTVVATEDGLIVLTACSENWPTRRYETPFGAMDRPLILER